MDRKQLITNIIFNKLDRIEDRLKKMAHEIPELNDNLKRWQEGELNNNYFNEFLNKFIDNLNETNLHME
jgi:predicted translin family RNA/ssDNA-binding protein